VHAAELHSEPQERGQWPAALWFGCVVETQESAWRTHPPRPRQRGMGPLHAETRAPAPAPPHDGTGAGASAHGCGLGHRSGRKTSQRIEVQNGAAHPHPIASREKGARCGARTARPGRREACSPVVTCSVRLRSSVGGWREPPTSGTECTGGLVAPVTPGSAQGKPAERAASCAASLEAARAARPSHGR